MIRNRNQISINSKVLRNTKRVFSTALKFFQDNKDEHGIKLWLTNMRRIIASTSLCYTRRCIFGLLSSYMGIISSLIAVLRHKNSGIIFSNAQNKRLNKNVVCVIILCFTCRTCKHLMNICETAKL